MVEKVKNVVKCNFLMVRMYFCYGVMIIFRGAYRLFSRKLGNSFDAIVEIRPELRNKITEKFF